MAGIFTKHIWQPCTCQQNELKREIRKKLEGQTGGQAKIWGGHGPPSSPLRIATVSDELELKSKQHQAAKERFVSYL